LGERDIADTARAPGRAGVAGNFHVSGTGGRRGVFKFMVKLMHSDPPLKSADHRIEGNLARSACPSAKMAPAKLSFLSAGATLRGRPLRDGKPLERGVEVVIERYEKGIAYVKRWKNSRVRDFGLKLEANSPRIERGGPYVWLPMEVVVGAGLLALVLLMVMIVVARMYRKAGPHEALIVYGMAAHMFTRRGAIIFPMVQTCRICRWS